MQAKNSTLLFFIYFSFTGLFLISCGNSESKNSSIDSSDLKADRIQLIRNDSETKVDVIIDGSLFTSYIFPDTLEKPVLYPIMTATGTEVTRGFPISPRAGERFDHPHHLGLWFNYGDVNGLDFWNNSSAIPSDQKSRYGHIVHKEIKTISSGAEEGILEVELEWQNEAGEMLLTENTTFIFSGKGNNRSIDRVTQLKAGNKEVSLKDNKEGMLGLRVARQLEHPSDKPELFTDASGKVTDVPSLNNEGVTGNYISSNGLEGNEVWGTRGEWVSLNGEIEEENISIVILDHPTNPGFPTYWHARGYGLFAANPLGQKALSNGKDELNFSLEAAESVTFRYRILLISGEVFDPTLMTNQYSAWEKSR